MSNQITNFKDLVDINLRNLLNLNDHWQNHNNEEEHLKKLIKNLRELKNILQKEYTKKVVKTKPNYMKNVKDFTWKTNSQETKEKQVHKNNIIKNIDTTKKPPSCYTLWWQDYSKSLKKSDPKAKVPPMSVMAQIWKEVPNEEKDRYRKEAKVIRDQHKMAKACEKTKSNKKKRKRSNSMKKD